MHDAPDHDDNQNRCAFAGRRRMLMAALSAAAAALPSVSLRAQGVFPTQPVRIIVPFGPGGFADITARLAAQRMTDMLGQQVLVENRPGAGGVVAAQAALAAPRDGHTLILFSNGTTIATTLIKLNYDPEADFVPVSSLAYFDLLLMTGKDSRVRDLPGLLAEGRKRQLNIGTINPGSTQHLSAELFKSVTGLNATHIPFKTSGDVLAGLLRGDLDVGIETYAALKGAVDSGQVHAIAATGSARSEWLPGVPTVREAGVSGYEVSGWNAVYAAKGVPAIAVERLGKALREVVMLPELRQRFLQMGADPKASTPQEMAARFDSDRRKWAQVIRQANIQVQ